MGNDGQLQLAEHRLVYEHLDIHIRRVMSRVELAVGDGAADESKLNFFAQQLAEVSEEAQHAGVRLPLELLRARLALTDLELETLVLVAALELDLECAMRIGRLRGEVHAGHADPQTCLHLFSSTGPSRLLAAQLLEPGARLFTSGLLERRPLSGSSHRSRSVLAIPAHTLGLLRGRRVLSERLSSSVTRVVPVQVRSPLPGLQPIVEQLVAMLKGQRLLSSASTGSSASSAQAGAGGLNVGRALLTAVSGVRGSGRSAAVRSAAAQLGIPVLQVECSLLGLDSDWRQQLERIAAEAELYGELVLLRDLDVAAELRSSMPAAIVRAYRARAIPVVFVHEGDSLPEPVEAALLWRAKTPMQLVGAERRDAWLANELAPGELSKIDGVVEICEQSNLVGGQIRNATQLARVLGGADGISVDAVERAVASQRRSYVGGLTQEERVARQLGLDDLVLDVDTRERIEQIISSVRHRKRVMHEWGFDRILSRGGGLICLFDGRPGTGKTVSAEVISRVLDLELHRINVSEIVDKYIGETEKNLTRLFSQIRPERTLLLFDEADSLFGRRVEVKSSTDRYANMAVNTLLQLVERHSGLVILTTNLKDRMDDAFKRRITFTVKFDLPDAESRLALWRMHLPAEAPLAADVDFKGLAASHELAGGHIKNACLRAALACADDGVITQRALMEEAAREAESEGLSGALGRGSQSSL